jgi:Gpi18-like mannosyltransferase
MKPKLKGLFYFSLVLIFGLRLYLQLLAILAGKLIPFKDSFPYREAILEKLGPSWLWFWGNFDGVHYINIAKIGYEYGLTQAFFPFYPLLIRLVNYLTHNSLWSGLIISFSALIGFLYFFVKLGLKDYSDKALRWAIVFLLLFPTSFFLFGLYNESLFLLLAAAALYSSRSKNWWLAAVLAGLASATRIIGIFLLPAIVWEYWQEKKSRSIIKAGLISLISASGLIAYLYYLQTKFNDFLIFIHSQPGFGAGRQVDKLVLLYQVIFRYLKMLLGVSVYNDIYPVLVLELTVSIAFLGLIIYAFIKKLRPSYLFYIIPAYLLPTLTGTFSSMPRYVLACFPLFYLLGELKHRKAKIALIFLFLLLLTWSFIRFARGYWLA